MVLGIFSRRKNPHVQPSHSSPLRPSLSLPNLRTSLLGDGEGVGLIWVGEGDGDSGYADRSTHYPGRIQCDGKEEGRGEGTGMAVTRVENQLKTPTKQKTSYELDSSGPVHGIGGVGVNKTTPPASGSGGKIPLVSGTPPQFHRPFSSGSIVESNSPSVAGRDAVAGSLGSRSAMSVTSRILDFRVPYTLRTEDLRGSDERRIKGWRSAGVVSETGVMDRSYPFSSGGRRINGSVSGRDGRAKSGLRGRKKTVLDLNVVVVGRKGVGKSSLANLLLTAPEHPDISRHLETISIQLDSTIHERHELSSRANNRETSVVPVTSTTTPHLVDPAKPDIRNDDTRKTFSLDPKGTKCFSALNRTLIVSTIPPHTSGGEGSRGTSLSRSSSIVRSPNRNRSSFASMRTASGAFGAGSWKEQKVCLNVIDTPGLVFENGRGLELERHLRGLVKISENRLAETLSEESQVSRRGLGMSDRLIHLVIYLIDPSTILEPPLRSVFLDSFPPVIGAASKEGVIFDFAPSEADTSARKLVTESATQNSTWIPSLRKDELRAIHRLAKRSNVLPIVTRADTLTAAQRTTVREAIRRDLEAVGLGWGGFDMVDRGKVPDGSVLLGEDSEEDEIGSREGNGSSGDLVESEKIDAPRQTTGVLPFFLFSPEASSGDGLDSKAEVPLKTSFSRTYPWCGIDALNPGHSDFAKLYSNMLGPLLMPLKDDARDNFYEQHRTERLLADRQAQAANAL